VFFAIGFETTTRRRRSRSAAEAGLANFSVFCNHVLTPAAITHILESPEVRSSAPSDRRLHRPGARLHGDRQPALRILRRGVRQPVVIAGFEPLDVMQAIRMLVRQ
jgi:hydrogenase expression/formation protein HypD